MYINYFNIKLFVYRIIYVILNVLLDNIIKILDGFVMFVEVSVRNVRELQTMIARVVKRVIFFMIFMEMEREFVQIPVLMPIMKKVLF